MEALMVGYGDVVLKSSLGKLGSFLLSEALLIRGVREDIRFIRDELQSMAAVMDDLIRAGLLNQQNKVWMLHVLQVACDAELCMDEFAACLGKHSGPGVVGAARHAGQFISTVFPRYRIAKMIQELKIRATEVSRRHSRYTITVLTNLPDPNKMTWRAHKESEKHYSHSISEDALIGMERSFKLLKESMKPNSFKVTAIVGPPGSGKTALAKMMYRRRNDPDKSIQASVWVTMSKERNTQWVLKEILKQLNNCNGRVENYDKSRLLEELKKQLTQKRFLLILDTFWRKEDWDEIKGALPEKPDGLIVLTTQNENLLPEGFQEDNIIKQTFTTTHSIMLPIMMVLNLTGKWNSLATITGWFGSLKAELSDKWFPNAIEVIGTVIGYAIQYAMEYLIRSVLRIFQYVVLALLCYICKMVWTMLRTYNPFSENARSRLISLGNTVTNAFQIKTYITLSENTRSRLASFTNTVNRLLYVFIFLYIFRDPLWHIFKMLFVRLFQRGLYYLTSVKQIPLYRARTFVKLISLGKPIFLSVPWAVKFICGALVGETLDFHTTDKFFQDLASLSEKNMDAEQKLMEVVKYCYQILSPTLRRCSEDLNILPEGYAIKRKRLTMRWVALGLLSPAPGLSEEEVAEIYFDELMVRGFIEPESVNSCGKIKLCRINSRFKEFLTKNQGNNIQTLPVDNNASFQLYDIQQSSVLERVIQLISLNKNHEFLTILDLEGCKDLKKKHLRSLHRCAKLRYLSFRNTDLVEIPKKTGKLKNLETLDVRQTEIKKVPKSILYLPRLKHLLAGCIQKPENGRRDLMSSTSSIEVPVGIERMSSLRTLAYVEATRASNLLLSLRELSQLKKLGLVIHDTKLNSKPLCISLMMLSASLLSLSILDERQENSLEFLEYLFFPPLKLKVLNLRGYLGKLPQWIRNHKRLVKLTIAETGLRSDAIRLIGKIPTLLCLKLYSNSFEEHDLTLQRNEFPVLQVLIIQCDTIQKISFEKGTTPRLEVFRWVNSKALPKEIYGINYLRMLKLISLIGDVHDELQRDIHDAVKKHPNHKTSLVFEKIEPKNNEKKSIKTDSPEGKIEPEKDEKKSIMTDSPEVKIEPEKDEKKSFKTDSSEVDNN